jgi:phage recombination protein Bet
VAPVHDIAQLDYDQVRQLFCKDADDLDIQKFIQVCLATGANPFLGRAYLMKPDPKEPAAIVFSKYHFVDVAEANPQFAGYEAGIIVSTQEGAIPVQRIERREGTFLLPDEKLLGGWAKVYRKDREKPFVSEVTFDQVAQKKKDGQLRVFWRTQPANMVRKVALVWALREAFSKQLGGIYEQDEVQVEPKEIRG